ncbi:MAG: hypothetical protein LBO03_00735 [Acidaminococcales bacterium]|nr:hypothetical protein [Acidaminococcales bacterium]
MAKVKYNKYEGKSRGNVIWDRLNPLRYTQNMSMARAQLLVDGYKEFDGYSFFHKRGLTVQKILREIPIYIDDDQLLVGDYSARPMGPEWFPDLAALWMEEYIQKYGWEGNKGKFFGFDNEAHAQQALDICEYFRNTGGKEMWQKYQGPEEAEYEHKIGEAGAWVINTVSEMFAEKAWNCPDIGFTLMNKGARGLIAEIDEQLEKLQITSLGDFYKEQFWKGLKCMLQGGIDYAHRYADLASEKAAVEKDPTRKAELEEIARVCRRVPEYPAETFQEALQSFQFGVLMIFYDTRTYGMGFGRVDQFLYPTFKKDIERGYIDQEYALQLLECFRVKTMGKRQFWPDVMTPNLSSESHFHNTVLAGVDPKTGRDAVNELSFLWLEAAVRVKTTHPTLSVRWHPRINKKFMDRCLEVVAMGMGFPAFFNDLSTTNYLLARGYTLEEARSYAFGGCTLHTVPGKTGPIWPLVMNKAKMLEMALLNGWDRKYNEQLGPATGEFTKMQTYEEFFQAYCKQLDYWADVGTTSGRRCKIQHTESFPDIMMSAFVHSCIKKGKVASVGGAEHEDNSMYIVPVGVQDVANALYVLKYHIFVDNPICSKQTLLDAMAADWVGYEELHAKILALPKFGNDIEEVDALADEVYSTLREIWHSKPTTYGSHYEVSPHSIGFHGGTGAKLGAMPCGRKAWVSMADGAVSPTQGTDVNGPTAVINSANRVDQTDLYGALFNMRFTPSSLANKKGRDNLAALIRTYFGEGSGKHIQFNVISTEQLRAAKKEPEKHKDLIVRVAGYSAYWTDLSETIQNELIDRSENEWAI